MQIFLKPHHALCIILFKKTGHSAPYASIMQEHIKLLKECPESEIVLSSDFDTICGYCPYNNDLICMKADEVEPSDKKILTYCGLDLEGQVKWDYLRQSLIDNILDKNLLRDVCKGCTYLDRCDQTNKERQ